MKARQATSEFRAHENVQWDLADGVVVTGLSDENSDGKLMTSMKNMTTECIRK